MADALCGPSNPLQQFKQQTQFDRTLQQDRLTSRHTPAQGFRSHDPNVGLLDPEFEAFQAGVPLPDLPQFQQRPPSSFVGAPQTPSWANDFQRMQISPPPPAFQQQHVVFPAPANASWAQGFREHVAQTPTPRAQTAAQSPQAFQHMARYGMNGFQSNFAQQPAFMSNVTSKGKEPVMEQYDEAAFAAAFDQASQDLLADEGADQMEVEQPAYDAGASTADFEVDYETSVDKARRAAMEALRPHQRRLSQDLEAQHLESITQLEILERLQDEPLVEEAVVQEENKQGDQHQQDDDDALAATAKELLEKVEHNKSDKFKNSQFLNLMRKLRDREMKVEGDQMIETAGTTTIDNQGLDATSSTDAAQDVRHIDGHTFKNISASGKAQVFMGNVHETETSFPLGLEATHVDIRPPDTDSLEQYQDRDEGRTAPKDGQEVVDYLNRKGGAASPDDIDSEFMMTKSDHDPTSITAEDDDRDVDGERMKRYPWPGWATPSWASGYYYPKDMEPDWLSGRT